MCGTLDCVDLFIGGTKEHNAIKLRTEAQSQGPGLVGHGVVAKLSLQAMVHRRHHSRFYLASDFFRIGHQRMFGPANQLPVLGLLQVPLFQVAPSMRF